MLNRQIEVITKNVLENKTNSWIKHDKVLLFSHLLLDLTKSLFKNKERKKNKKIEDKLNKHCTRKAIVDEQYETR